MESTPDHADHLAAAERAAAAPYVDYPATPPWYAPAVGAWAGALVGALLLLDEHPVLRVVSLLALVAVESGFIAWYRRYRGTMPTLRRAPAEMSREFGWYFLGLALVVAVVAAAALWVSGVLAAVLAFVLVTVGAEAYERRYARAAAATRARLG
jgi:hypothetical protein